MIKSLFFWIHRLTLNHVLSQMHIGPFDTSSASTPPKCSQATHCKHTSGGVSFGRSARMAIIALL